MTEKAIKAAEQRIQAILLDLAEEVGQRIDQVNVDTRTWANCSVEIFLEQLAKPIADQIASPTPP